MAVNRLKAELLAYSSLGSSRLLGSGISGLLARTVSKLVSLSQAVMEVNFSI